MNPFVTLLAKRKCPPLLIFWEAMNYYEKRISRQAVVELFDSCCEQDTEAPDQTVLTKVPDFVMDYCLDCLAGKMKPLKMKMKGGYHK